MSAPTIITEERLERAVRQMARIVALHGATYLPILERLGRELIDVRQRRSQLLQVISSLDAPSIDPQMIEMKPIKSEPAA